MQTSDELQAADREEEQIRRLYALYGAATSNRNVMPLERHEQIAASLENCEFRQEGGYAVSYSRIGPRNQ
jgi:hypothetical protein